MKHLVLGIILLGITLTLAFTNLAQEMTEPAIKSTAISNPGSVTASARVSIRILDPDRISNLEVEILDGKFVHDKITAYEQDFIYLTISNKDGIEHSFILPDLEIILGPHESKQISFDAPARGAYKFYCTRNCENVEGKLVIRRKLSDWLKTD